jgi:hypothetical protein
MNLRQDRSHRYLPPTPATSRLGGLEATMRAKAPPADEALIVDARGQLRPAQQVEDKLLSLLRSVFVPVSHFRLGSLCRERGSHDPR